jgi:hypothetical protein
MSSRSRDGMDSTGRAPRAVSRRGRQLITLAAASVMIVGAFLLWGPIGIGNGPLEVPFAGNVSYGSGDFGGGPVAYVVPLVNSGRAGAVLDQVTIVGVPGQLQPRLLAAKTGRYTGYQCWDLGPLTDGKGRSALPGCVLSPLRPAAGLTVPGGTRQAGVLHNPALVLELAGPAAGRCWVLSGIVLHYHVGFRHYSASSPQGEVSSCGRGGQPAPV